jgi:hypothetical protein
MQLVYIVYNKQIYLKSWNPETKKKKKPEITGKIIIQDFCDGLDK